MMKVKVAVVPGKVSNVVLDEGTTIADAIRVAGIDPSGYEMKVNSVTATNFNEQLSDGDMIFLAKQIKGNSSEYGVVILVGKGNADNEPVHEVAVQFGKTTVEEIFEFAGIDFSTVKIDSDLYDDAIEDDITEIIYSIGNEDADEDACCECAESEYITVNSGIIDISALKGEIEIRTALGTMIIKQ